MLASDQSNKSMPFASVRGSSGSPGSNAPRANGRVSASATADSKTWFVLHKGTRHGPYTFAALENMAERGLVDPEAGVWCLGWAEWRIARNVPGLFEQAPEPDDFQENVEARVDDAADREGPGREAAEKVATAPPAPGLSAAPLPAPARESRRTGRGGGARLAVVCVLAVIMIVFGAGWAAISLDIIRVEFMPTGVAFLKQVEAMLAGTCAVR
jgi:GYF domain 2